MKFSLGIHAQTGLAHLTIHSPAPVRLRLQTEVENIQAAADCYERTARQHDEQAEYLRRLAKQARDQAENLKTMANL